MNVRKWFLRVAAIMALCAVLLPALSASAAVRVGGNYPIKNQALIKTITTASGISGVEEFPVVSFEVMNPAKEWQKPIIDRNTQIAANPSSFMNRYSEPGEIRRGDLVLVDMWVFRINYQNDKGDIILNPWTYRSEKEIQYVYNTFTLQLNPALISSAGFKIENFGLRFMDMIVNYNNRPNGQYCADDWERNEKGEPTRYIGPPELGAISTGPKDSHIQRTLDTGAWHFATRSENASEDFIEVNPQKAVNTAESQIIFESQWPAIYTLYYFDTPEFAEAYGTCTEGEESGPIPTLGPCHSPSPTPIPFLLFGNPTGSGTVNIADILLIRDFIFGTKTPTPEQFQAADVCSDGVLTLADILRIKDYIFYGIWVAYSG